MRPRILDNGDEISLYEQGQVGDEDPLHWWKIHESTFPGLAKMSQDMLAVPATKASAERVFSQAKLLL
jgi:hypothetical protein